VLLVTYSQAALYQVSKHLRLSHVKCTTRNSEQVLAKARVVSVRRRSMQAITEQCLSLTIAVNDYTK